jgi:protein CpxP
MKISKASAGVLFLTIVFVVAFAVEAGHFGRHHGPESMAGRGIRCLKTMLQLDLSDSQKSKMLSIITKYENESENLMMGLRGARRDFTRVFENEIFNEDEVRNALRRTAPIREELQVMRLRMLAELKTVLTPEQRELFKELRAKRIERLKARFGTWLESDSRD